MPLDVVVIGGGQAGLAVGFYLRRTGLRYVILDEQPVSGGAWQHTWPSLLLFSPAQWSSLPGWMMPRSASDRAGEYPTRKAAIDYLAEYERRYALPVERPVRVNAVHQVGDLLELETNQGRIRTRAVVSATGSWANPMVPDLPGRERFSGVVLHSAHYPGVEPFVGQRVVVVGGGNSGAQIAAELADVADVTWATREPPTFLPAHVDGRYLFEQATARYKALQEGREPAPARSLGDIVRVPPVQAALERGTLAAVPMFERLTADGLQWADGREEPVDAVILATGFRPALSHLAPLGVVEADGRVAMRSPRGTRIAAPPPIWLVGYGGWTGFASATLVGVGRSARSTVDEIMIELASNAETTSALDSGE